MSEMSYLEKLLDGVEVEWRNLGDTSLFEIANNGRKPVKASLRIAGETPYYGANNIQDYVDGYTHDGEYVLIAEDGSASLENYSIQYATGKFWANNHVHVVRGKERIHSRFLYHYLCIVNFLPFLTGGGRAKLTKGQLIEIPVPIPCPENPEKSLAIQSEIVRILDKFTEITAEWTRTMNSQTKKDIPCFRSYLPDALRLRFEDKLTIRAIAQRLGLSHSTIHTLFQRFIASGIAWPLPDSVSLAQLDAILYANRKKELTEPQISEGTWRKERRASYSREFKVRLAKQALQPGAVVARIAREHGINDNLLFKWKSQYEDGLLSDDDIQECMPVPVALTDTPEPTRPVTNPFWRNKPDECPECDPGNVPRCELHLKSGVVKLFAPLTPEMLRALIREMKGGTR